MEGQGGAVPEPGPLPVAIDHSQAKAEQLQEILEGLVGSLKPGNRLPSERVLAERYGVARMTARRAVDGLVAKGLAYRVQGHGTFVAEPRLEQPERLTSFTEDMRARGLQAGSVVLSQGVVPAPAIVARHLELPTDALVVRIERIRTVDGGPIALEWANLPAARFRDLEGVDLSDRSLYEVLARRWGVELAAAEQRVRAVALTEQEAKLLATEADRPAFLIERTTQERSGQIVEYVRSVYRGDRFELHHRLQRVDPARVQRPVEGQANP